MSKGVDLKKQETVGAVADQKHPYGRSPGVQKVSVSLAAEDLAWAKREAVQRKMSLSAVVSEALRRERKAEALASLLQRCGADKIDEGELASLRAELYRAS